MVKSKLITLTKKLISFPTASHDKEKNYQALDFIKEYFFSEEILIQEYEKNGFKSLILTAKSPAKVFDLILHGHIDVVPASSSTDYEPFIKDGKLYGRGSLDMKSGLAIMLTLFKELVKSNNKVALYITSDEELSGVNGTKYLLEKHKPKAKFFITLEGDERYVLKYEQKGILRFALHVKGKGKHASYPWLGDNAIKKFFRVYEQIEQLFPEKQDKDRWYSTINLGTIHGGTVGNAVPDSASGMIDIRIADDWESPEKVLQAIRKIIKQTNGASIQDISQSAVTKIEKSNPDLQRLNTIARKHVSSKKNFYFRNPGTNDTRYAVAVGIPGVSFGPVGANFHAQNEFVEIDSIEKFYVILHEFIETF